MTNDQISIAKIFGNRFINANILDFSNHPFGSEIAKIICCLDDDHAVVLAPTGAGKTHLACAIAKEKGEFPNYMQFEDLVRECEQRSYRGDNYKIHLHALCNSRFLILDEMGDDTWSRSSKCPILKDILLQVIRERRMYLKPTLFLGDCTKEEFLKLYGGNIWEEQKVFIWDFPKAPSMRQQGY